MAIIASAKSILSIGGNRLAYCNKWSFKKPPVFTTEHFGFGDPGKTKITSTQMDPTGSFAFAYDHASPTHAQVETGATLAFVYNINGVNSAGGPCYKGNILITEVSFDFDAQGIEICTATFDGLPGFGRGVLVSGDLFTEES